MTLYKIAGRTTALQTCMVHGLICVVMFLLSLLTGGTALVSSRLTRMTSTRNPRPSSPFSSNPSDHDTTRSHRVGNGHRNRLTLLGSIPSSFHPSFQLSSRSTKPKILSKICSWEPRWSICRAEQTKTSVKSWTLKGTYLYYTSISSPVLLMKCSSTWSTWRQGCNILIHSL